MHKKTATLAKPASGMPTNPEATVTVLPGNRAQSAKSVSEEAIRLCAFQKWEAGGKPPGDGVKFWIEAERELLAAK